MSLLSTFLAKTVGQNVTRKMEVAEQAMQAAAVKLTQLTNAMAADVPVADPRGKPYRDAKAVYDAAVTERDKSFEANADAAFAKVVLGWADGGDARARAEFAVQLAILDKLSK